MPTPIPNLKHFTGVVIVTSLAITGFLAALRWSGHLERMELEAYDDFIQLRSDEPMDERILVVGVSEEDIQTRQEYPLEDGTLADLLVALERHNPRAIGIDIARDVPQGPPAGRERLLQQLAQSDLTAAACLLSAESSPGVPPPPNVPVDLVGFADLPQDIGGVIRRSILVSTPSQPPVRLGEPHLCNDARPDNEVLSLSLLLAILYLEQEDIVPEQTETGELLLGDTVFHRLGERSGGYAATGATDYQIMLNYRGAQDAVRQVTLTQVLDGTVDPTWIQDRIVLIGYTSQVANDILTTPFDETTVGFRGMPGVIVHAQATSQILSAVLDGRPLMTSWSEPGELLWIWLIALGGGTLAFLQRRLSLFLLGLLSLVALYWGLCFVAFLQGVWLPLIPGLLALVLTAIGVRLTVQANQWGYSQAIYEQLRDHLRGHSPQSQTGAQVDYIEDLVRRARRIRQQREGIAVEQTSEGNLLEQPAAADTLRFASTEQQAMYDQIRQQVQQDWENEQAALEAERNQAKLATYQRRVQTLIQKSQQTRGELPAAFPPASKAPASSSSSSDPSRSEQPHG